MPSQVQNNMQQMEFFDHTITIQLFFHHLQDMRFVG